MTIERRVESVISSRYVASIAFLSARPLSTDGLSRRPESNPTVPIGCPPAIRQPSSRMREERRWHSSHAGCPSRMRCTSNRRDHARAQDDRPVGPLFTGVKLKTCTSPSSFRSPPTLFRQLSSFPGGQHHPLELARLRYTIHTVEPAYNEASMHTCAKICTSLQCHQPSTFPSSFSPVLTVPPRICSPRCLRSASCGTAGCGMQQ